MKLVALILLLMFSTPGYSGTVVRLSFRDSVLVSDTLFALGQIAGIETPDQKLSATLAGTVIGESAPAGYSRFAASQEIVRLNLSNRFPNLQFQTAGAVRTKITTDYRTVSVEDLKERVIAYLHSGLSWPREDCGLEIENGAVERKILPAAFEVTIRGLENSFAKGPVRLTAEIVQGTRITRIPIVCRIKVTTPVVVATRTIGHDQRIDATNAEIRRIDITRFSFGPYVGFSDLHDRVSVRTISPGTIIHTNLVRTTPAVKRGDQLYLMLDQGNVTISVMVRAREDARPGQRIWVENTVTNKLIRVIVEDRTRARLVPEEAI